VLVGAAVVVAEAAHAGFAVAAETGTISPWSSGGVYPAGAGPPMLARATDPAWSSA
jgi:hypothetical protein